MTREELLDLGIYCPNVFDDRIIIYLRLGFTILFFFKSSKYTEFYYLLSFNPDYNEDPINSIFKNYNHLHVLKELTDIMLYTGTYNDATRIMYGNKFGLITLTQKRFISIFINETDTLQQYINNFRYGYSD